MTSPGVCSCGEQLPPTSGPSHVCKRVVLPMSGYAPGASGAGAYPQSYSMSVSTDPDAWVDQLSDAALDRLAERLAPRIERALLALAKGRGGR